MSISFDLSDDLRDIVDMVHKVAAEELRPHLRDFEHEGRLPDEVCQTLHQLGVTTLPIPAEYGGPGLDLRAAAVLNEEIAWGDVGAALAMPGSRSAGAAVRILGTPDQKERLLRPFAADDAWNRRGAFATVEGPFGLTPGAISTVAEKRGDRYVLSGEKRYVLGADAAELTIVLARDASLNHGDAWQNLALFAVEGRPAAMKVGERHRTLGLNTAFYAPLKLDGLEVPAENKLPGRGEARRDVLEIVARKQILDAARLTGCMRAASEYAFKYATERKTFGKFLYEHQALAFMMADMATRVEACRWLIWRAAWRYDSEGKEGRASLEALGEATVAFRHASELAVLVTTDAVQILGGHGYIQDHPVEKWMRDARCLGLVDGHSVDDDAIIAEAVMGA